jgi:uncharacterized protein YndB with AHSA1/START domain
MAQAHRIGTPVRPKPLIIARTFGPPRALVFKAWSSAEHIKRWFSPEGMTVPEAELDFRPEGVFDVCMRSSEGQDFWSRGHFTEILAPDRLAFTSDVTVSGECRFTVHTVVTFADDGARNRMSVQQDYEIFDEAFLDAVEGSAEGWRTTLDRLEREVAYIQVAENRSVVHAMFSIERSYKAPPPQVFHALTDPAAKARWFGGGDAYTTLEGVMDVRPGGRECVKGRWENGMVSAFDAIYFDVIPNERLVYSYEMSLDTRKISISLATMELWPEGAGTRLVVTEQGAFLDGYDDGGSTIKGTMSRQHGTAMLLDRLGASLES